MCVVVTAMWRRVVIRLLLGRMRCMATTRRERGCSSLCGSGSVKRSRFSRRYRRRSIASRGGCITSTRVWSRTSFSASTMLTSHAETAQH